MSRQTLNRKQPQYTGSNMAQGLTFQSTIQDPNVITPVASGIGTALGGPVGGALIGAGAATLGGILSSRAQKKQQQRQLQAQAQMNIGQIEQETAQQKNVALSNIIGALRSAFLG